MTDHLDDFAADDMVPQGSEETSREAFRRIRGQVRSGDLHRIIRLIAAEGLHGSTCDEAEEALSLRHQTCSARFNDLGRLGVTEKTGGRRATRSGSTANVHVLTSLGWECIYDR